MSTEQSTEHHAVAADDEIDLRQLVGLLWAGKWLIAGVTAAASLVAVVIALLLPDVYKAEALLAPNDRDDASGLASLAAQYGGSSRRAPLNSIPGYGWPENSQVAQVHLRFRGTS